MTKKIVTIGFELAGDTLAEGIRSKISLLDWDIVLFRPQLGAYTTHISEPHYRGKPALSDSSSFQVKESLEHWRREIKEAVEIGKTVVVFLSPIEEVYVATGKKEYSGGARSARVTRHVEPCTNYRALPLSLVPIEAMGSAMKLTALGNDLLAPFWDEFGSVSQFRVILPPETRDACIVTKTGDRPVGAIVRSKNSSGSLILLPDIDFCPEDFIDENEEGEQFWTKKAQRFAACITKAMVALDNVLRSSANITPPPGWAAAPTYLLATERRLESELLAAERQVEEAQKRKEAILEELKAAGRLRALLYEKGRPLENAIIDALQLMGFQAAPYKDDHSEFDVVFEAAEGRLLGEAEGKDSKAINVDKLRQLAMNVHEDLQREEVKSPAKAVLFGNGYRLSPPERREVQFTDKCITAAESSSTALVTTSTLYVAAQYLSDHADAHYAKLCRTTILTGVGPVGFPPPPVSPVAESPEVEQKIVAD
jgi:hypothetical protein